MAFKKVKKKQAVPETPEQLFNDLKQRAYPAMLSYQADVTREYCIKALKEPDVALQLPTGSGKTLVGLMTGEWRRRKYEERVLYLCPTNQLVYQVFNEAKNKYGLRVVPFTGSKKEYQASDKSAYRNAEAIAVTSYSSLFNTAPFFTDPQIIILDDAHAAENYIASQWTLRISNFEDKHKAIFAALSSILKPLLPLDSYLKMVGQREDAWTRGWVEKLPTPQLHKVIPDLIKTFNAHVHDTDLYYPWSAVGSNLHACHLYFGAHEIEIRPLIPPTNTHTPFEKATQRIYMSATLGAGGDLERLTGKTRIKRLEVPSGWDTQGIGRRFFLFPAFSNQETMRLISSLMDKAKRSLMLVPNNEVANQFHAFVNDELGFPVFNARDIEKSKDPFINAENAVTIVANRYDGIDFPNNECRLLIAYGLPRTTNLQERFIVSRMSAITLLNDRILTRVIQAIGRCTRSPTDYSAILILGDELLDYLLAKDSRKFLHPELQAEIEFGQEQSKDSSVEEYLENFDHFLEHGDEWADAEDNILEIRSEMIQAPLPGTTTLRDTVLHEVKYQYCLWNSDFSGAIEQCRIILSKLTDPELKGYRALWNYLAGSVAYLGWHDSQIKGYDTLSRQYFSESSKAAPNLYWLNRLAAFQDQEDIKNGEDQRIHTLLERMELVLENLGVRHDGKFENFEKEILSGIMSDDAKKFESAQVKLGQLLGYEAGNQETRGAPDPWWLVDETLCFIFEDHSNAQSTSKLSVEKARQASTHPNWVREHLGVQQDAIVTPVLVSPVREAEIEALPHLKKVYYWNLDQFREWASNAVGTIKELRKTFTGSANLAWRADAIEKYRSENLCPTQLLEQIQKSPANEALKP